MRLVLITGPEKHRQSKMRSTDHLVKRKDVQIVSLLYFETITLVMKPLEGFEPSVC